MRTWRSEYGGVIRLTAAGLVAALAIAPAVAQAEPPCGRGWRKHEPCGGPLYVEPAPIYVLPPAVVYVPAAPAYRPPPGIVAPQLSIGVQIPLR